MQVVSQPPMYVGVRGPARRAGQIPAHWSNATTALLKARPLRSLQPQQRPGRHSRQQRLTSCPATPSERIDSSIAVSPQSLVSRRSALARRVPRRGGRNARPVSWGPSGPTRGQGGAPAAASRPLGRPQPPTSAARRTDLDAGVCRAGWYSRRVRASAERGRVQGPGRAEADLGPKPSPSRHSESNSGG